jgi:CRISPR-associated protein Csd2
MLSGRGIYVFYGSMNPQLAEKTKFSEEDAQAIKEILPELFENDESTARPAGSMEVLKVLWWKRCCKSGQYSSVKVHGSLKFQPNGESRSSYIFNENKFTVSFGAGED